jgi:hypothetical protein
MYLTYNFHNKVVRDGAEKYIFTFEFMVSKHVNNLFINLDWISRADPKPFNKEQPVYLLCAIIISSAIYFVLDTMLCVVYVDQRLDWVSWSVVWSRYLYI